MAVNQMEPIWFTPPPVRGRYTRGLWKDNPSAPAPPDPYATAAAQSKAYQEAAKQSTELNRYDQKGPFGSSTWTNDGGNKWTNTFSLDPRVQSMLNTYLGQANQAMPQLDTNQLPAIREIPQADEAARKSIEDAYYNQQLSRLDPHWKQEEDAMRARLANQGITQGSQAYDNEMSLFGRNKNDAYSTATNAAILNSTGQMGQLFGMGLAAHDASLGDRQQAINETQQKRQNQLTDRQSLLNEIMAMQSGAQVNAPGSGAQANVGAAPVAQSIYNNYQGEMANYNAGVASNNATMGTLGALGGSAMMAWAL